MTTAAVLGASWAALVLGAAWSARPRRARRHLAAQSVGDVSAGHFSAAPPAAPTRVGAELHQRLAGLLGSAVLVLVGVHRPDLAVRLGQVVLVTVVVGVAASPLLGVATAVVAWWLPPVLTRRRQMRHAQRLDAAVPELAELMLVAMRSGAAPRRAFEVAARWAPHDLRAPVGRALVGLDAGQRLDEALWALGRHSPALQRLAAAVIGAVAAGSPVAATLADVAAEGRRTRRQEAQAAARRLPVLLLFPLTLCILPAFGLLTVGPALATGVRSLAP